MTDISVSFMIEGWDDNFSNLDEILDAFYYEFEMEYKVRIHTKGVSGGF